MDHLHLAYELRNVYGSVQCAATDVFSLGRVIEKIGIRTRIKKLIALGMKMQRNLAKERPSLNRVLASLRDIAKEL